MALGVVSLLLATTSVVSSGEMRRPQRKASKTWKGMVKVPAGPFTRGSDTGDADEKPVRQIYLDAFWIDKHEVTAAQYRECVRKGGCKRPEETGTGCTYDEQSKGDHPINCVNWFEADAYCRWAGKALPTEAQWEKAARGTDARTYPWGNDTPTCRHAIIRENNATGCGRSETWPVGSKPDGASPYGALDMVGNVWEWTADWYESDYYTKAPSRNPPGPKTGVERIARGSSWSYTFDSAMRVTDRVDDAPGFAHNALGMRCVRP